MDKQRLTILGATGSIGCSTLEVIALHPNLYEIYALSAFSNINLLLQQCQRFKPPFAVWVNGLNDLALERQFQECGTKLLYGYSSLELIAAADEVDTVMAAIVGVAGLASTLAAAKKGKKILLANKESLVVSGSLLMDTVKQNGAILLPVDSEHNAIFQSLPQNHQIGLEQVGVETITLTASGGPFLNTQIQDLEGITPVQACKHPNWSMGKKISVDSATMMNKALELIEACWLFNARAEQVEVLIHPQSIIHSMVSYKDGSVIAQLGFPDMRTPIAHALAYPNRIESGVERLNLAKVGLLQFQEVDQKRFPAIRLAYDVIALGGTASTIMNAANEVAVACFLNNRLKFNQITEVIETVLHHIPSKPVDSLETLVQADIETRKETEAMIKKMGVGS